jgi:hypothetical protein
VVTAAPPMDPVAERMLRLLAPVPARNESVTTTTDTSSTFRVEDPIPGSFRTPSFTFRVLHDAMSGVPDFVVETISPDGDRTRVLLSQAETLALMVFLSEVTK